MRCISLLVSSFAVLIPALASAQPALTESAQPAPQAAQPSSDLQVSAFGGGQLFGSSFSGVALEGGHHLAGRLWLHGMVGAGSAKICNGGFFDPCDDGTYRTARIGLEARRSLAGTDGIVGGFAGIDVGASQFTSQMAPTTGTDALALARFGLDIGSEHLRARTSVAIGTDGVEGSAGIAFQW
jgi:hypothetical protein